MAEKSIATQRIGDEAVANATGKNWEQWLALLDRADCKKMTHKEIVALIAEEYAMSSWWSQMVAATYEQSRGLREVHENPQGFEISVSKTINLRRELLFTAWNDHKLRHVWLKNIIVVRKATPEKSLRITWSDGVTSLSVELNSKGENKTQVVVQHQKLADAKTAEEMKVFWRETLSNLEHALKN
jgi:uncharacterized protein YndB with AHSA1/START domain